MGYTIAEKIMGRASRAGAPVPAGTEVEVKPDYVLGYDFPGYLDLIFKQMKEEFGIDRVAEPERYALFIDHMVPANTPGGGAAHRHPHLVRGERRQAPRARGHRPSGGGRGRLCRARRLRRPLRRPRRTARRLRHAGHRHPHAASGGLRPRAHRLHRAGDHARKPYRPARSRRDGADVFHHLVRVLGPRSCRFQVLELGGPALGDISLEGRQTITGLAMFTGALTAICNPDRLSLDYAREHVARPFEPQASDEDATYAALHDVDLTDLAPIVVVPPNPAATADLSDHAGLAVQAGYLGSCASGRLEDLRAAAAVLKGRRVAPGFQLHIVPTSQAIMADAAREGLLTTLIEAGAFVTSSSCDYCYGRIATMTAGQRAVSTGTLNVTGRMGSPDSEIYLCNAAAVAASALEGRIADPRPYLAETAP